MRSSSRRTTILDIARETKASAATVSRVLSNSEYPVRPELRERILRAAESLYYQPNIFSQMLRGGTSKIIGIIVPSIANPYYSHLVSKVEAHCIAAGYVSIICSSHHNPMLEQNHLETLKRQQVAGILLSTINANRAFLKSFAQLAVPCVLFERPDASYAGNSVIFDFRRSGEMATRHLLENGHRRIVFAAPAIDRPSRKFLYEGYKDALKRYGIRLNRDRIVFIPGTDGAVAGDYDSGMRLAERIMGLGCLPDAIVAVNDITAIGIMNALFEGGVQVPSDVSIIGFDDIAFSSMVTPTLTTIRQSTTKTAELVTAMLFRHIADPSLAPEYEVVEPEFIERRSVRILPPKKRGNSHERRTVR